MRNTKIDWADATWNPITGCLGGCEYCYARRIAKRFQSRKGCILTGLPDDGGKDLSAPAYFENIKTSERIAAPYPFGFQPTFHRYKLDEPLHWQGFKDIFVCSMSDLFGKGIPKDWTRTVLDVCAESPRHRYMLLTKQPQNTKPFAKELSQKTFWVGTTVTCEGDLGRAAALSEALCDIHLFLSIEPLLGPLELPGAVLARYEWVIIGAETGSRKEKVVPNRRWMENITFRCQAFGIPVFMKSSLLPIMGSELTTNKPPRRRETD